MSDFLAINKVTQSLKTLLEDNRELKNVRPDSEKQTLSLEHVTVTAMSPEFARTDKANQINLFLYAIAPNGAMRNLSLPPPGKAGDQLALPLPLNLSYLVTTYGQDDNDLAAHALLGWAVRRLYEVPLLRPGLLKQTERVRITMQSLSVEELSKLWMMFKVPYCPAAAFQADVVVIEPTRLVSSPLPVLFQPGDSSELSAQPDLVPAYPTIESMALAFPGKPIPRVELPARQPCVRVDEELVLRGHHLNTSRDAPVAVTRFRGLGGRPDVELTPPTLASFKEISVFMDPQEDWRAGVYSVSVTYRTNADEVMAESNDMAVVLAPRINLVEYDAGQQVIRVKCTPQVSPDQSAVLVIDDRRIAAREIQVPTDSLEFKRGDLARGTYFVRLRVDGTESLLVKDYAEKMLKFDTDQQVDLP